MSNDKYFELIDRKTFLNEEAYSDFLFQFESDYGKIDHVIQRKPKYRQDLIILEIIMEKEEKLPR